MAILYEIKERKNPQDPTGPGKFYPNAVRTQNITFNQLADAIAERSTVSKADVAAALYAMEEVIVESLKNSMGVRLGDLGIIYATLRGTGAVSEEAFTAAENIDEVRIHLLAGAKLKKEMQDVEFKKVEFDQ